MLCKTGRGLAGPSCSIRPIDRVFERAVVGWKVRPVLFAIVLVAGLGRACGEDQDRFASTGEHDADESEDENASKRDEPCPLAHSSSLPEVGAAEEGSPKFANCLHILDGCLFGACISRPLAAR